MAEMSYREEWLLPALLLLLLMRERIVARLGLPRRLADQASCLLSVPQLSEVAEGVYAVLPVREEIRKVRVLIVGARLHLHCSLPWRRRLRRRRRR